MRAFPVPSRTVNYCAKSETKMTSNTVDMAAGHRRIKGRESRTQSIATRFTRSEEKCCKGGLRQAARICANGRAMFCSASLATQPWMPMYSRAQLRNSTARQCLLCSLRSRPSMARFICWARVSATIKTRRATSGLLTEFIRTCQFTASSGGSFSLASLLSHCSYHFQFARTFGVSRVFVVGGP